MLVFVRELKPGDHIRWYVLDLVVERVVLEPMFSVVSVFAGGRQLTFEWGEKIELITA
jgi:hypothetical protein